MKKISTLFKKDPNDLSRVINEINPENSWVIDDFDYVTATRKFDGTACAIIQGVLFKRYDVKKGKSVPEGAIPCQQPDEITGHWPHWVECDKNKPEDRYFWEGIVNTKFYDSTNPNGTYELCGPKVQGNPENLTEHVLLRHGSQTIAITKEEITFNKLKEFLTALPIEGIVFHHQDGRMCKLRKSDYGIKR